MSFQEPPREAEEASPAPRKKKLWKDVLRLACVALFFVIVALALDHPAIRDKLFNIELIRAEMDNSGWQGLAAFMGIAALVNAMGIPRLWICAVTGSLFGAVEGTFIGLLATLAGSTLDFMAGRSLLRGPIKRHMPQRLRPWHKAFNRHGFRAILYLRLFPAANATVTSLLGGASTMKYRDYLLATVIGFTPFTIVFATLGSSAAKQSKWQMAGGLGLFAAVALGQWLWSRARKKSSLDETEETQATAPPVSF